MSAQTGPQFETIRVSPAAGVNLSSATSGTPSNGGAGTALPTMADGSNPRYVRVLSTAAGHIKFGSLAAGLAAAATDCLINATVPCIFTVVGEPFASWVSDAASPSVVNIVAIDR